MKTVKAIIALALLSTSLLQANELGDADHSPGKVYTLDNAPGGNHVLTFLRAADGALTPSASFSTGGVGTGAGLGSQGALLLTEDGRWLLACNGGSDQISAFAITRQGLRLTDRSDSGGRQPISLTLHGNLLYVLNAGGGVGDKDNITAFLFLYGRLVHLPGSARALSGDNTGPAEVSFTSDGETLVVTEKATSLIDTYTVGDHGLAKQHKTFASPSATPFGFAAGKHNRILVSNASDSSLSAYQVSDEGDLSLLSGPLSNTQKAACWAILTDNNRFAYTANAGSGSISGYRIGRDGTLELLDADGRTGVTGDGSHPIDMALSHHDRFLYSLNSGNGTISAFEVKADGALEPVAGASGLPGSVSGLASW